ncbi:hypothetical protein HPULCUR_010669 [Helicostylum pulchrum]|uniref:Uncharacterized protein n=1 Tax=Helicostylum pulchrum TaxID=562976 RepID=A0ABP9YDW3_9FUNG
MLKVPQEECSGDDNNQRLLKRKYDMYEAPSEVENPLIEMKAALMKPFVESGVAKLKQYRKSHPH